MELRQLRYFVTLANHLHFGAAAERLGITQPALSNAIKLLETDIGTPLLERGRKKITILTPAGTAFLEGARRTLEVSERARQSAIAANDTNSGSLSIGHTDDFISDLLPDILDQFNQLNPGIVLNFQQSMSFQMPALLIRGVFDCIFETKPLTAPLAGCAQINLPETRIVLAVPTNHPLCKRSFVKLREIENERHLYYPSSPRSSFDYVLEKMLVSAGVTINSTMAPSSTMLQLELVRRGRGISFVTEGSIPPKTIGVRTLKIDHSGTKISRALVWRKGNRNPALKKFVKSVGKNN